MEQVDKAAHRVCNMCSQLVRWRWTTISLVICTAPLLLQSVVLLLVDRDDIALLDVLGEAWVAADVGVGQHSDVVCLKGLVGAFNKPDVVGSRVKVVLEDERSAETGKVEIGELIMSAGPYLGRKMPYYSPAAA